MVQLADPALLAALMLLIGIVGGYAAALVHVPRVVGYLLAGVLLHYTLAVLTQGERTPGDVHSFEVGAGNLSGIRTIALGLIMFSIGNVFEARRFHAVARSVLTLTVAKLGSVLVLLVAGCSLAAWWAQGYSGPAALALGLLLSVAGLATAPAATLMVLREYEAKGPNSDTILTLTALNNIVCIVLFHTAFIVLSGMGVIESSFSTGRWLWLDLLLTSVGSIALGITLGFLFSVIYVRITIADFMLIFIGLLIVLGVFQSTLAEHLHLSFNFLLTALFIGATFANITPDQEPFHNALRVFSGPVFALFFVLAGFDLHMQELAHLGWVGAAYVMLRVVGKGLGGWLGVRWLRSADYSPAIGLGMLCQAGVAIGLSTFVFDTWGTTRDGVFVRHPAAAAFHTVILGSVVLFEIFGPIVLRHVALATGEVKAVTLLRRRRTPGHADESVLRQAWEALVYTFIGGGRARKTGATTLQVRHIMRSNVKVLSASARFDEVLHFVEKSRHNHFPVVEEDGSYVGMIHYADLRHILYDPVLRELVTATDLARADTPTVTRDTPLDELFRHFHDTDVGSIAVLEVGPGRRVIGIVEQRDLLLAMRHA